MLTIGIEKNGAVAVVRCAGRLVRGEAARSLQDAVSKSDARIIILDLSAVKMMDAGGLTALVSLHLWAQAQNKQFKVINPSRLVCQMLSLTHLDSVLEISSLELMLEVLASRMPSQGESCHAHLAAAC